MLNDIVDWVVVVVVVVTTGSSLLEFIVHDTGVATIILCLTH